mmetsp:Transcript_44494/g.110242  ORF Transcript_44494/g.110242 Transcript_44494/m.110242 type:complete len:152 (+) Transcript_44494:2229-2684(+)
MGCCYSFLLQYNHNHHALIKRTATSPIILIETTIPATIIIIIKTIYFSKLGTAISPSGLRAQDPARAEPGGNGRSPRGEAGAPLGVSELNGRDPSLDGDGDAQPRPRGNSLRLPVQDLEMTGIGPAVQNSPPRRGAPGAVRKAGGKYVGLD